MKIEWFQTSSRPAETRVASARMLAFGLLAMAAVTTQAGIPPVTNGLQLHLVADDATATVGGTVDTWSDSNGGAVVATQATAGKQPELVTGVLNGHDVLRFDGSDDQLILSDNIFAAGGGPKTVFAVIDTGDVNGHIIGTGSSSSGFLNTYGYAIGVSGGRALGKSNNNSNGVNLLSARVVNNRRAAVVAAVMSDGNNRIETTCSYDASTDNLNPFAYTTSTIAATGGNRDPLAGDIAEILVYDRALTSNELATVKQYLASTYGIEVYAPVDADANGVFDACDARFVYLNDERITVSLLSPAALTGGTVANVIDAVSAEVTDPHNAVSHVYNSGGPVQLRFDLQASYDMYTLHFWNYFGEAFDTDQADFTFYDRSGNQVGQLSIMPQLGVGSINAEAFNLDGFDNVRVIEVTLTGTNGEV
ncbi:MAG: LamG domain-containing protein, partial [Gammaproteobacteria bacterium]|nr:LamG domain-containing protein [Gammaproteobacteria bacterium]